MATPVPCCTYCFVRAKVARPVVASKSMVQARDEAAKEGLGVVAGFGAAVVAGFGAVVVFCADAVAIKARARARTKT